MDFLINEGELGALCGLPYIQQLAYLRGIRPYMDVQTCLVGIKRGISYQSIAEQLYVEPHPGIKSASCSRMQVRRALSALERMGLITLQSQGLKLILKCEMATRGYSVQNKVDLKATQQADSGLVLQVIEKKCNSTHQAKEADIPECTKADTPLKDNNYIYLLSQFEKFWSLYPEKKSRQSAWHAYQLLNPNEGVFSNIMSAIETQIKHREAQQMQGEWVPPWKYPANWLTHKNWEDEINMDQTQEKKHATVKKNSRNEPARDMFWIPDESENEQPQSQSQSNVIQFQRR